jgi:hypothetical protein
MKNSGEPRDVPAKIGLVIPTLSPLTREVFSFQ